MGRTSRKREGKCILLLTETEERKFKQAKDTYAYVQKMITQGTGLTYYKSSTSLLPNHYKPALCRKHIHVGEYQNYFSSKNNETSEKSPLITDPFMNEDAEQNMTQVMKKSRLPESLKYQMPLQIKATPTHFVGHSKRTIDFVNLVQKMEHRILHPYENLEALTSQTQLIIPAKSKTSPSSRLNLPKKKPRRYVDNDTTDLATFYKADVFMPSQENDCEAISFLQDIEDYNFAENSTSKSEISIIANDTMDFDFSDGEGCVERMFKDINRVQSMERGGTSSKEKGDENIGLDQENLINKGKAKANDEFDEFDTVDIDIEDWEQMLTKDMYDQGIINTSLHKDSTLRENIQPVTEYTQPKEHITRNRNAVLDKEIELKEGGIIKNKETSHQSNIPTSFGTHKEQFDNEPYDESVTVVDMDKVYNVQKSDDEDDFGFDDFPLDELFQEEAKSW